MNLKNLTTTLYILLFTSILAYCSGAVEKQDTSTGKGRVDVIEKWPFRPYAYAKAYLYNLENNLYGKHAIVKDNKLDPTVMGEGVLLEEEQIKTVLVLTNGEIGGLIEGLSKSYIPHHGIVFFDENDSPVAYITFCFDCEAIRVSPETKAKSPARELTENEIEMLLEILQRYKQVIEELKLPVFKTPFEYSELGKETTK